MKKIDRYIISRFLATFFFTILIFIVISIVIDITEKIDDFLDNDIPWKALVFDYYLNFVPYIGAMLSPLFIFIAVIYFTSKMAYDSEIVAMLSGGMSFYRLLFPYMFVATLLTAMLLLLNHWVVPNANKERIAFEFTYIRKTFITSFKNVHLQVKNNEFIYMENYNSRDTTGYKFTLENIKDQQLNFKIKADKIHWNSINQKWNLYNYVFRKFSDTISVSDGKNEKVPMQKVTTGALLEKDIGFNPGDIKKEVSLKEAMNYVELTEFIEKEKMRGADNVEFYELEHFRRTSSPFSVYILTLIAVAIASRKVRGGMGLHIAAGIAISASYVLLLQFSMTFTTNANLPAVWGVWIPNLIFAVLALWLLKIAQK